MTSVSPLLLDSHPVFVPDLGEMDRFHAEIRTAIRIRKVEERLLQLFGEGKLFGTVHTCIGQEFSGVAVARCLQPQDYVFSNHRCHGHFISYGGDIPALMAEIMGKATGNCGGRGGSQHLCQDRFFSNGIQGGIAPVAAGLAYAQQIEANGGIAVAFLGDGTLGQGVLYETMNIASKWNLPLLFVVENNFYAQSTSSRQTLAGDIAARFQAFGIEGQVGNTWEWQQLLSDMEGSVTAVRSQGKPRFYVIDTYRLKPHSKGDDFRDRAEIQAFEDRDPLQNLLMAHAHDPWLIQTLAEVEAEVDAAVEFAAASPFDETTIPEPAKADWQWAAPDFVAERINLGIQRAIGRVMEMHPKAVLIGEDLEAPYGGAFKVSGDLSLRFPGRVRNTPISEAAIVGIGNGMALAGHRPMVEIMFGDFLTLATDQWINHAAKFAWMYNGKVHCPIVLRTPMGGRRGYGPTHSQSLERHFLGLPGTFVVCLHHRQPPQGIYDACFDQSDCPVLIIENKRLYAIATDASVPAGYQLLVSAGRFPVTWLCAGAPADLTVVAIGGTSVDAEAAVLEAFDNHDIVSDLFLPTALYPLDIGFLEASLHNSRRLLVVEEGLGFAAVSSEIMAQVAERWPGLLIASARTMSKESPIPTSRPMEEAVLPTKETILQSLLALAHG